MTKYSEQFKLMVVKEYLEGALGYKLLAEKYGIPSSTALKGWVKVFQQLGPEALMKKEKKESYSVQFKLDVLTFMKRTGSSQTEAALHFGITNPSTISIWNKVFSEGGAESLGRPKGRPSMSNKDKKRIETEEKEMTREQELERENELLRLEVEYLKKLRAFQMDPEGYLEKHKQRYHSNSKKPSD
ncbi:helix-turn-helix domain-containing protein [Chungangia koreensis]|uniref:Helix-turn-helix domain-containing protein n=1 Tax=Chungangia koreensis TaxID=752657 RepID=A0ABV8X5C1_9LACT